MRWAQRFENDPPSTQEAVLLNGNPDQIHADIVRYLDKFLVRIVTVEQIDPTTTLVIFEEAWT